MSEEYSANLSEIIQIYNEQKTTNYINSIKCKMPSTRTDRFSSSNNTLIEITLSRSPVIQYFLLSSNKRLLNDVSTNDKTLTKAIRRWLTMFQKKSQPIILDAGVFYKQGTTICPVLVRQLA